jgi:uncharacterized protein (TIGR02145 family)
MKQLYYNYISAFVLLFAVMLSSCSKTYHLTVESNDPAMGTVYGTGDYAPNTEAEIGAQAAMGYVFVRWNDGNTDNPRTVRISSDLTFTAIFKSTLETGKMTDSEGREYNTVKIGGLWWMAENLAAVKTTDGQIITVGNSEMSHHTPLRYTSSGGNVLYNWPAAQSVCPDGWHLPSSEEWASLEQTLGADPQFCYEGEPSNIAKSLAVRNKWQNSSIPGTPGHHQMYNNTSEFAAVPFGKYSGDFIDVKYTANFWLSDSFNDSIASSRTISYDKPTVNSGYHKKNVGLSVRCVREATTNQEGNK